MYFYDSETQAARAVKQLAPGIEGRTFWGEKMLCAVVTLAAGSALPHHSHFHEQAGVVLEGLLELTIEGETRQLHPGDLYIIPGDVPHSATVPVDTKVLDIFSPVREEYKS